MNPKRRRPFQMWVGVAVLLVIGAVVLWAGTGRETFTRYFNAALAATDQPTNPEADALLSDALGLADEPAAEPANKPLDNQFHFGLLPGGGGRHVVSVASVVALAGAMVLAGWIWARGKPSATNTET